MPHHMDIAAKITAWEREREALRAYLLMKAEAQDWHGVADAAMDLREVDAKLEALKALP